MKKDLEWLKIKTMKLMSPQGLSGKYWRDVEDGLLELIERVEEEKKELPAVPKYVANYIEDAKSRNVKLLSAFTYISDYGWDDESHDHFKVYEWFVAGDNDEAFACAWLNGYTVEEKKYVVELKGLTHSGYVVYLAKENDNSIDWSSKDYIKRHLDWYTFTEEEINRIDPRYMAFAVPVEEVTI